ncbi:MAG: hypothetical protein H7138_17600 [Myxococcales bacterium]|nr:hypothetical protein [Myxococcales bacterium]
MSYLAVQRIQIAYDDDHRGRVHAEQRTRIRAFPISAVAGDGVYQHCRCTAWQSYEPTITTGELLVRHGLIEVGADLLLRRDPDRMTVLRPATARWGAKTITEVPLGSWARLVSNMKISSMEHKYLQEVVVNAGLFPEPPDRLVFLGEPTITRDDRRDFLRNGTLPR